MPLKPTDNKGRDHLREVVPVLLGSLVFPVIVAGGLWLAIPWPPARIVLIPMLGLALGTAILWKMLAPPERAAAERLISRLRQKLGLAS